MACNIAFNLEELMSLSRRIAVDSQARISGARALEDAINQFKSSRGYTFLTEYQRFIDHDTDGRECAIPENLRPFSGNNQFKVFVAIYQALNDADGHLARMRQLARTRGGIVVAKDAAQLLLSLGLSDAKSIHQLAKNLGTVLSASDEFERVPGAKGVYHHKAFPSYDTSHPTCEDLEIGMDIPDGASEYGLAVGDVCLVPVTNEESAGARATSTSPTASPLPDGGQASLQGGFHT